MRKENVLKWLKKIRTSKSQPHENRKISWEKFYTSILLFASFALIWNIPQIGIWGIIIPTILTILALYLWQKKKFVDKEMLINFIILVSSSQLLFFGIYMLNVAYVQEHSYQAKYQDYRFNMDISSNSLSYVYNFLLSFDFSKNSGNITFTIDKDALNKIENIHIDFPSKLSISSIKLSDGIKILSKDSNFSYDIYNDTHSYINIGNFKVLSNDTSSINFLIEYQGTMYPFGRFVLDINAFRVWSAFNPIILFNLGNYDCGVSPCFSDTQNSILSNTSSYIEKEGKTLKIFYPNDYYGDASKGRIMHQEFILNMVNSESRETADRNKAIGTGIIVSSIFSFIEFFVKSIRFII